MPLIDNECFLLHAEEFSQVHNFITPGDRPITLGRLALERGQDIQVGINGLFASHIGIFGNTGSGKSYTLARLYHLLFADFKQSANFRKRAEFLLIDFNGEYTSDANDSIIVEPEYKRVFRLSTRTNNGSRLPVAAETVHNAEFWTVFLEATEKTQKPFLRRSVESTFLQTKIATADELRNYVATLVFDATHSNDKNVESDIIIKLLAEIAKCFGGNASIDDLIQDYREHLHYNSTNRDWYYGEAPNRIFSSLPAFEEDVINAKIANLTFPVAGLPDIDQVRLKITLNYYADIVRGFSNKEHISPLLMRMDKRLDDLKKVIVVGIPAAAENPPKNLTVISLKDVNVHIRKVIPLLVCKQMYEEKKRLNDPTCYLNLIIDEAHNILSESSERESEQWKDYRLEVFEEIIKEGRKFGVFVTLASQRPSDISPTIISQLHNYFLHRLINNQDIKAVERTVGLFAAAY